MYVQYMVAWPLFHMNIKGSQREPRLLARVDAKLLPIMPKLQILLDKGKVTFNNTNKRKRFWLLNFPRTAVLDFMTSLPCQGSRLTFQLASPVATDRFDSLAKTDFSLARYSDNLK